MRKGKQAPDSLDENGTSDGIRPEGNSETVGDGTLWPSGVADRVAEALLAVDRAELFKSQLISKTTLSRVQKGGRVKRATLIALAAALGVSKDWLIEGVGPKLVAASPDSDRVVVLGPHMPFGPPTPLFGQLDMDRAASALRTADFMFAQEGKQPTPRERVQAMALIYDHLTAQQASKDEAESLKQ